MQILLTVIAIPVGFFIGCYLGLNYWHDVHSRYRGYSKTRPVNEREPFPL